MDTVAARTSSMRMGSSTISSPIRQAIKTISVWKISSVVKASSQSLFANCFSMLFKPCVSDPGYRRQTLIMELNKRVRMRRFRGRRSNDSGWRFEATIKRVSSARNSSRIWQQIQHRASHIQEYSGTHHCSPAFHA